MEERHKTGTKMKPSSVWTPGRTITQQHRICPAKTHNNRRASKQSSLLGEASITLSRVYIKRFILRLFTIIVLCVSENAVFVIVYHDVVLYVLQRINFVCWDNQVILNADSWSLPVSSHSHVIGSLVRDGIKYKRRLTGQCHDNSVCKSPNSPRCPLLPH